MKQMNALNDQALAAVAPHAGAWIETSALP